MELVLDSVLDSVRGIFRRAAAPECDAEGHALRMTKRGYARWLREEQVVVAVVVVVGVGVEVVVV